jgi:hypothetical protein
MGKHRKESTSAVSIAIVVILGFVTTFENANVEVMATSVLK